MLLKIGYHFDDFHIFVKITEKLHAQITSQDAETLTEENL